jgi:hypothetical protein
MEEDKGQARQGQYGEAHFTDTYNQSDVRCFDNPTATDFKSHDGCNIQVGGHNVNGMTIQKLTTICAWLLSTKIPIHVLSDVRGTEQECKYWIKVIKNKLGKGTVVLSSPVPTDDRSYHGVRRSGGILMVIQPSFGLAVLDSDSDPGKLGILLTSTIRCKLGNLKVIGTYWPTHNNTIEDNGLWNRTIKWMRLNDVDGNPLDYIQQLINKIMAQHISRGKYNNTIVVGDLNSTMHPGERGGNHNALAAWCETTAEPLDNIGDLCSRNISPDRKATRFSKDRPGSVIDHILVNRYHYGLIIQAYSVDHNTCWEPISDFFFF